MRSLPPQAQELLEKVASGIGTALKPSDVPQPEPSAAGANGHGALATASAPAATAVLDAEPASEVKSAKRLSRD